MPKCKTCGKTIIGSDLPECFLCSIGKSPEALAKKVKDGRTKTDNGGKKRK